MSNLQLSHTPSDQKKRPFWVRLVCISLLSVTIAGWLRLVGALQNKAFLAELGIAPELQWYLILSGFLWGVICLPALWAIYHRRSWSKSAAWLGAGIFLFSYWFERFFLWESAQNARNYIFMLLLCTLWLILLAVAFKLPGCRTYLKIESNHK